MKSKYFVLGAERVDYISKKTNERVLGCIVYVGQTIENGTKSVANVFMRNKTEYDFPEGCDCRLYYNRYGTPNNVEMI